MFVFLTNFITVYSDNWLQKYNVKKKRINTDNDLY